MQTKAIVSQLEAENHELKIHLKLGHHPSESAAASSMVDKDSILGGGAAVISDATKTLARKVKSNLMQTGEEIKKDFVMRQKSFVSFTYTSMILLYTLF